MKLSFSLSGIEINISLRRQMDDREFIYIPPSGVLKAMQIYTKLTTDEQIQARFAFWKNNYFWKRDKGYTLVQRHLERLLGQKGSIVDIGCSSAPLPFYLKHFDLWKKTEYLGIDIDTQVLELDRREHPEGKFLACDMTDAAKLLPNLRDHFDVVYSKGTICVTYFPFQALGNILSLNSYNVFLLHTPLTKQDTGPDQFISTLCVNKKNAYIFTIMNEDHFIKVITEAGFHIIDTCRRRKHVPVINFGSFQFSDFLLSRI